MTQKWPKKEKKRKKITNGVQQRKNSLFQQMVLEQLDTHMQKEKKKKLDKNFMSFTKITQDYRLKCNLQNPKTSRRKRRGKT